MGTTTAAVGRRRALTVGALGLTAGIAATAGAPQVAIASAPSDWKNVKTDFGALGDGSGDDRTAIQNAINAAASQGSGLLKGGIVYIPPGVYPISDTLQTTAGVVILGAGASSRISLKAGVDSPALAIRGSGDYCQVRDLHITSLGPHTSGRHGVAVQSTGTTAFTGSDCYLTLQNLLITNMGGCGVYIGQDPSGSTADVREFRAINVVCADCSKGTTDAAAGILVNGTDGVLLSCTVVSTSGPGIRIIRANNRISDCKAFYNRHEFVIEGSRVQLSNCQAQDGYLDGFRLVSTGAISNVSMSNCQADSNAAAGFRLSNVTNSSVVGLTSFVRSGKTSSGPGMSLTNTTKCRISGVINGFSTPLNGTNTSGLNDLVV